MKLRLTFALIFALSLTGSLCAAAPARTWVFFGGKGFHSPESIRRALLTEEQALSPAARLRLSKVRPAGQLVDERDLPICAAYLDQIVRLTGLRPHAICRSINAASYAFSPAQIDLVCRLPFVRNVRPVRGFPQDADPLIISKTPSRALQDSAFYGDSYLQNQLEDFPLAHDAGYNGQGVLVGMLDAGWNNLAHVCFDSLEIIATWDFVNGDTSVANDPGQMGEGSHGTKTLSCLAGFDPRNLIGTAYGISVALAKTENTDSELPIEEDNWAAGIEWLDSLGCVIATSSLSYPSLHTYPELNGDSTVITIAADNAVARGMVVVNSMGNHGADPYPSDKMGPPADGDSVLGIGAVQADSQRASFSSIGPTFDGRIKPDLMALGVSVKVASPYSPADYTYGSGTSFSAPITAGACALLLQADPALTPMQVHDFLKDAGTQADNPDTLMGWGIYDVWRAIQNVIENVPSGREPTPPEHYEIVGLYPNPFNPTARLVLNMPAPGEVNLIVFDISGRQASEVISGYFPAGRSEWTWDARGLTSGAYLLQLSSPWGVQVKQAIMVK